MAHLFQSGRVSLPWGAICNVIISAVRRVIGRLAVRNVDAKFSVSNSPAGGKVCDGRYGPSAQFCTIRNDENAYYRSYKLCSTTTGPNITPKVKKKKRRPRRAAPRFINGTKALRVVRHPVENPFGLFFAASIRHRAFNTINTGRVTSYSVIW